VRAWTTTILRRLFLTGAIRAKRRRLQTDTDAGGALDAVIGRNSSPYDDLPADVEALGDRLEDAVKRALDRVPEIYRTSFLLSVVRDLSCEEIGQQLRVPVGTVMSRVHRARKHLRDELAQQRCATAAPVAPRRRLRPTQCRFEESTAPGRGTRLDGE
jgi:RNA polymerase sigma-70 factor (ECF subfamily)